MVITTSRCHWPSFIGDFSDPVATEVGRWETELTVGKSRLSGSKTPGFLFRSWLFSSIANVLYRSENCTELALS